MSARASLSAGYGLLRSLWLYRRPGRQRALRRFYRPFVGPGELVFDIGAHVGDRTRAFAGLGARVAAVEPNPALAARLQRSFAGHAAVDVIETAVGEAAGLGTLHVSSATPTVSSLNAAWTEQVAARNAGFADVRWDRSMKVPVTTLARLIEQHGEPVFCKIDVEGHEASVLAGLDRPLGALSFEFVQGMLEGARDCVDRLAELGDYEYNAVEGERRRFLWPAWRSADGVRDWLDAGAGALASGDLYARRRDAQRSGPRAAA